MKRLTYSLAAKTAAVILSFVFAVLTAGCVFAGGFYVFRAVLHQKPRAN